jgi:hypothetical protein
MKSKISDCELRMLFSDFFLKIYCCCELNLSDNYLFHPLIQFLFIRTYVTSFDYSGKLYKFTESYRKLSTSIGIC